MGVANDAARETVSGIRAVKSLNAQTSETRRYDDRLMDTHNIKTQRDTVRAVYLLVRRVSKIQKNTFRKSSMQLNFISCVHVTHLCFLKKNHYLKKPY